MVHEIIQALERKNTVVDRRVSRNICSSSNEERKMDIQKDWKNSGTCLEKRKRSGYTRLHWKRTNYFQRGKTNKILFGLPIDDGGNSTFFHFELRIFYPPRDLNSGTDPRARRYGIIPIIVIYETSIIER